MNIGLSKCSFSTAASTQQNKSYEAKQNLWFWYKFPPADYKKADPSTINNRWSSWCPAAATLGQRRVSVSDAGPTLAQSWCQPGYILWPCIHRSSGDAKSRILHADDCLFCSRCVSSPLVWRLTLPPVKPVFRVRSALFVFRLQRNNMILPRPYLKVRYCEEPPWPRGSVIGLIPLTILRGKSWLSLACMCTTLALICITSFILVW